METPTTPITDSSYQGEDWLLDLENLSPSDAEFLAQREARHKRVGELLRELHYLGTSNPHPLMARGCYKTEEAFWLGQAQMYPGFLVESLEQSLSTIKNASSTAALQATA